jgi:hypothetical protein
VITRRSSCPSWKLGPTPASRRERMAYRGTRISVAQRSPHGLTIPPRGRHTTRTALRAGSGVGAGRSKVNWQSWQRNDPEARTERSEVPAGVLQCFGSRGQSERYCAFIRELGTRARWTLSACRATGSKILRGSVASLRAVSCSGIELMRRSQGGDASFFIQHAGMC